MGISWTAATKPTVLCFLGVGLGAGLEIGAAPP
jgi:hypothetical protein